MSQEDVKATRYTCDGCGKSFLADVEIDGPAEGFHGSVMCVDASGGFGGDWFACTRACIRNAVIAAVESRD
jgi:hypothetical protein